MRLTAATSDDIAEIHELIEGAYRGDSARSGWTHEADLLGGQRTDREALAAMLADPLQHLLVHRESACIAACIAIHVKGGGLVYIGMVTVDPLLQGAGIGRMLLDAAERHAAVELGAQRIEMTVLTARGELIAWYERRGYGRTDERRPFPVNDPRFGLPKRGDLEFVVLEKRL